VTRLQATVALLQAWLDYFPWPETWTGELQRKMVEPGSKPKDLSYVVCDQCGGDGCKACWFKGRFIGDPYLAERGLVPHANASYIRFVNCDVCGGWGRVAADSRREPSRDYPMCDGCDGSGKVPAAFVLRYHGDGEADDQGERSELETAAAKRDDLGVYQDLHAALEQLAPVDPYGHLLVQTVWVLGWQSPQSLHPPQTVRLVNGTRTLEAAMPDRFEKQLPGEIRAQHAHRQASLVRARGKSADRFAQRARDEEIRRLHHRGASLDELARKFSLDKSRISRITRGER
jgi:hypothetical protein